MSERRHYSGPDLATLLRRVDDELGSDAVIVKADRVRNGGMAGFFTREHYEVVASTPEITPEIEVTASPSDLDAQRDGVVEIDDEAIARGPRPPVAPAPVPAPRPPAPAAGRSIQAALLDRADQVSTEELLNRAAELTTAERGNESFRSILGRAVAGEPERAADSQITGSGRHGPQQADLGPSGVTEPIVGLRPEPVRPGETVIEPMPEPQPMPEPEPPPDPADPRFATARVRESPPWDGQPGSRTSPSRNPSAWPSPAGPPPWGTPWGPAWVPWMVGGSSMPPQPVGVPANSHHCSCAGCSHSVPTPAIESAVLVNSLADGRPPTNSHLPAAGGRYSSEISVTPWELRREIDEAVRLRLDEIFRVVRRSVADEVCDCRREPADRPPVDHRESAFDRPPPPDRRGSGRRGI